MTGPDPAAGNATRTRFRGRLSMTLPTRYLVLIAATTIAAGWLTWRISPGGIGSISVFVTLFALGVLSVRLKVDAGPSDVDISFTAAVFIVAVPLLGPFGATVLATLVPFVDYRRNGPPLIAVVFNSLMYSVSTAGASLVYVALGGPAPLQVPGSVVSGVSSPVHYLIHLALPLLAADVVFLVTNTVLLAGMLLATGVNPWSMLFGPALRTLPIYVGYTLTGFLFVILWVPSGLGPLAAVLIVAPLIVARWAYRQYVEQRQAHAHIIDTLAGAGRSRDRATARAARVEELARLLQVELQLGHRDVVSLTNGAALHDIGMLAVPRSLLRRSPNTLAPDELRLLATHTEVGYEVVRDIAFLADTAQVVRHHHERVDGSGYPSGLIGAQIPLAARVLAVADAYEAAVWSAAGPVAQRHDEAVREISARADTAYDRRVVDALGRVMRDGPPRGTVPTATDGLDTRDLSVSLRPATAWVDDLVRAAMPTRSAPASVLRPGRMRLGSWPPGLVVPSAIALVIPFLLTFALAGHPGDASDPRIPAPLAVIVVYLCTLVAAERFRVRRRGRPEAAPMALAAGLAMALTTAMPGVPVFILPTWIVVGSVALAILIDWVSVRWRTGADERANLAFDAAVRLGVVSVVAVVMHDIPWLPGQSLATLMTSWPPPVQAALQSALVIAVLVAEVPVRAWWRGRLERTRVSVLLGEQFRNSLGLGAAMAATGVLVAASQPILGLLALPLVLIPLVITQLSVKWHEDVRFAQLQAIRALSRLPEEAGLVPKGHAARVARLSVSVARDLGMSNRDVEDLEHAALLHDVGQVSLRRPIPSGATVLAAPGDQERIARLGAEIAAQTGELAKVSEILDGQAVPYHRVIKGHLRLSLASRIIKVVNAYDDFVRTASGSSDDRRVHGLERLYLGLRHEFDPTVVSALERVVGESPDGPDVGVPPPAARLDGAGLPERAGNRS